MSDVRILTAHVIGGIEQHQPLATIASGPDPRGACAEADPEAFMPEHYAHAGPALSICGACPFKRPCAQAALTLPRPWGVWAGVYLPWNHGTGRPGPGNRKLALDRLQAIAAGEQVAS